MHLSFSKVISEDLELFKLKRLEIRRKKVSQGKSSAPQVEQEKFPNISSNEKNKNKPNSSKLISAHGVQAEKQTLN